MITIKRSHGIRSISNKSLLWMVVLSILFFSTAGYSRDMRIVEVFPGIDNNQNKIQDFLEKKIKEGLAIKVAKDGKEYLDLIVCLNGPPDTAHYASVTKSGGIVQQTWKDALYGMHILLPANQLESYVKTNPSVVYVKENSIVSTNLAFSTQQIRVRDIWKGTNLPRGYTGNSTHKVAIIDTGIDTTHSDLNVALYYDFNTTNPAPYVGWDGHGHGTHVTGIISGKGTAGGLEDFHMSYTRTFYTSAYYGYYHYFPVNIDNTWKSITAKLYWDTGGTSFLGFRDAALTDFSSVEGSSPLMTSCLTTNLLETPFLGFPGPASTPPTSDPYYLGLDVPYKAIDNYNLLRGMAPDVKTVALRVLGDSGSGTDAEVNSAFNWLVANCSTYNIIAANASLGSSYQDGGGRDPVMETAVNNAVNAGCSIILSAGNGQASGANIGEPAYSANAITVAAVSNLNKITNYSSLGVSTETIIKPDISAPGGSSVTRRGIVSTDSNNIGKNVSIASTTNISLNDYVSMNGTSMASPHVAGVAALIADALGSWQFGTNQYPFTVKNIILMTAWECAMGESAVPTLNRGGKDLTEGYGRINPDACIEAVTLNYQWGHSDGSTLGSGNTDKKVWARKVNFTLGVVTVFLQNPASADFDIYLYRYSPDSIGQPVILASNVSATAGTNDLLTYNCVSSQNAYLVVKQVTGSGTFTINSPGQNPPSISNLPSIKLFQNQNLNPAFDLKDYNTGGEATTYSVISSFLGLSTLTGSQVYQVEFSSATVGVNSYKLSNSYGDSTSNNQVKYSSYKIFKLPKIGMNINSTIDIPVGRYVYASTGLAIPPSFGNIGALASSDFSKVTAQWLGNTVLRIQILSSFVGSQYIDVIASPNSIPPFGVDLDKERIWVYPNRLANSTFSTAQDTTSYAYQQPPDKSVAPSISYYSAMTDKVGEIANGVARYSFSTSAAGTKATLQFANHLSYDSTKWYTARMRIFSPDANNSHQTLLYNYGGVVGRDPHIDIGAYILFGTPTVWTWMECPILTFEKSSGYVQFFLKAGSPGAICIDEIQIIEATPTLIDANRGPIRLKYPYGDFDVATDTVGWGRQNYPNAVNNYTVTGGQLWVDFSGASSSYIEGIKWTANNASPGIYTPTTQINREVGIKGKIQKISGNFNSYSSIFLLGAYGVQSSGQGQIAIPMSDLLASAEFGRLTDGVHYVVGKSINAYHQFQFAAKNDQTGVLAIDDVDFLRDQDDPNYGDAVLYP